MKRFPAIIVLFLAVAGVLAATQEQEPRFQVKVAVDLVNVNFSATDNKGRMVPGLTAEDFAIEEDGVRQEIALFSRERELPLTLAMLVDISPSVARIFEEEKRTAASFLESVLGPRDIAMVISFDRWATLVQDYTESLPLLRRAIENLTLSKNGTSLYDAVYLAAAEKLAQEAGRKAIVLMSDGEDTTSKYELGRALIAAHRSDVVVYAISNGGNSRTLRELAEETGGAFFRVRRDTEFQEVFDRISLELRTQYSLAYHSTNAERDGSFRRIKIVPKDSDIRVRARRGYYAPDAIAAP